MRDVFVLAQEDTTLSDKNKVRGKEYAGPCPNPDCDRKTDGFLVRRFYNEKTDQHEWKWMCRGCWPADKILPDKGRKLGWGDAIDYLRHFRKMPYRSARNYLDEKQGVDLQRVLNYQKAKQPNIPGEIPNEYWQEQYRACVTAAENMLGIPEGQAAVDYLRSRALEDEIIKEAHLGYAIGRNGRPCIVIPWYDRRENGYWRVSLRDITPGIPKEERYSNSLGGFSTSGMYLGDSLLRKLPTFLVEGELDALSIFQAAGDIVNVVATGSVEHGRVPKWQFRLACMPAVLIAFDRSTDGDIAAQDWLRVLNGATPVLRYRPLVHDVNEMLMRGYNVRSWVQGALDYLNLSNQDTSSQPVTPAPPAENVLSALESAFICSECGIDLTDVDRACYDETGVAFCNYDENGLAFCSRGVQSSLQEQPEPPQTYEQFMSTVNRLAAVFGPDCKITPVEKGYTLEQHVAMLEQQQRELDRQKWQSRRRVKAG